MANKKNIIIFAAVFLIIVTASAWIIYRDFKSVNIKPSPENGAASVIPANPPQKADEIKKLIPNLDREISIRGDLHLSEDSKTTAIAKIKEITAVLKKDYDRREEWLTLGLWRKTIGDYEGAEQAWRFVILIRPNDPVAYHNLGDLYAQYLPDFSKAEKYYLAAIEKDASHNPFYYSKLYEFYRYFAKKPDLAEKTILDGLKTNPRNQYLEGLLNDLRQEKK